MALTSQAQPPIAAPQTLTAAAAGSVAAPNSLTPSQQAIQPYLLLNYAAQDYQVWAANGTAIQPNPISTDTSRNVRIGYKSILTGATPAAAAVCLIPNTFERWRPATGTQSATFTASAAAPVDYVAIAAHNIGTSGATVQIETAATVGGAWTSRATLTPSDNKPIYIEFTEASVQQVRITLTGGSDREVGVVYAGKQLIMSRYIYGGHSPVNLSSQTEYRNSVSETGQWLGRTIARQGLRTEYSFTLVDDAWYRANFQPFVESAKKTPFFIKWRPDLYPLEAAYVWTTDDIKPSNRGGATRLMQMSFNVEGHDDIR